MGESQVKWQCWQPGVNINFIVSPKLNCFVFVQYVVHLSYLTYFSSSGYFLIKFFIILCTKCPQYKYSCTLYNWVHVRQEIHQLYANAFSLPEATFSGVTFKLNPLLHATCWESGDCGRQRQVYIIMPLTSPRPGLMGAPMLFGVGQLRGFQ